MEKKAWETLVQKLISENILHSPKVIRAMRSVPRASFIPSNMRSYSAADTPLPIGYGQTISAPHSLAQTPS